MQKEPFKAHFEHVGITRSTRQVRPYPFQFIQRSMSFSVGDYVFVWRSYAVSPDQNFFNLVQELINPTASLLPLFDLKSRRFLDQPAGGFFEGQHAA